MKTRANPKLHAGRESKITDAHDTSIDSRRFDVVVNGPREDEVALMLPVFSTIS